MWALALVFGGLTLADKRRKAKQAEADPAPMPGSCNCVGPTGGPQATNHYSPTTYGQLPPKYQGLTYYYDELTNLLIPNTSKSGSTR